MISGFPAPFGYVHTSTIPKTNKTLTLTSSKIFHANSTFSRWCNELFPVYFSSGSHILDLDGAGVDAFGIVNCGCHFIAYVTTSECRKYWVPRRAKTKMSFPGMLDNTVGGSLRSAEKPLDCIVREAEEEAGLPVQYTRAHIKACGTLSYQMSQTVDGKLGCQHHVQYVYEMEMRPDMIPIPLDSEADEFKRMTDEFKLMAPDEVIAALRNGEFKLNDAMTWMAFLIRHRHVNADNEPSLLEICARLHLKHDLLLCKAYFLNKIV
ncbi:NUDIX hydrolase domain-like protein [Clohesyomyces aquaticus]|uniref:NUDIX hydrolase domain-like protein n=1 Tax=Clohesyomyces aquaticus TaxID=1231657 RepID=A0A1Y1ZRP0_9PLEO|nr:NUDIX hydrolase domain-like protein [Clohesyomyces aquaticus]